MQRIDMLIDGRERGAHATYQRLQPISGEAVTEAPAAQAAEARAAADAAQRAFPAWAALGPQERRVRLLRAVDCLAARAKDFTAAMMAETGATAGWAAFNVHLACDTLREAAAMTTQIAGEQIPSDVPGSLALTIRQPAGVVLGIAPWNAPVILGVRAVAMPLACGNTVVLKASEACPATHRLIGSALHDAGLGDGVVNVVTNAPQDAAAVVRALIEHPAVRRVNFTGSTHVGRIVAEIAARVLKPVLLELGGKNALIVLEDADLDAAAAAATFGAFMNQGQICMSSGRVIVDAAIADEFIQRFVQRTQTLIAGDPRVSDATLGSLISAEAGARVGTMLEDALSKGGRLIIGGQRNGAIFQPTIVDRITSAMALYDQECFGPVAAVVRVAGEEEAIRVANDTQYGLSAAVFGRDVARAFRVAKRIHSGICHINGPTVHDEAQMPFGGVNASGYGRFGGKMAIAEFTDLRWITVQTEQRHYPF